MDPARAADKRPNIVMLMTDDTGWNDFGCYSGGSISMVRTSTEHEPTSAASARKRTWAQSCALSTLEKVELRRSTKKRKDMQPIFTRFIRMSVMALLALAVGCTSAAVQTESLLASAGFRARTPSTPRQQQHFKTLTPDKMMTVHRNGKTYHVYADPVQNRLYIGNQAQFQNYQQLRKARHLALEQEYSEAMGDWGAWEPFGA